MTTLVSADHKEVWREHPALPGYYFSSEGRAGRKLKSGAMRVLSGCECGAGYRAISTPDGKGRYLRTYIHSGVCELFNGQRPAGMECRHLDGNKRNNHPANLRWGTPQENSQDKERHGTATRGEKNPGAKLKAEAVREMRRMRAEHGTPFYKLAEMHGVSTMTAYRATVGHTWK